MSMPLKKPEGISWNPASLELPDIPMLPAGQDALSATISAVLPTLAAPLAANVATLQAKETMFSGKLGAAQTAYQNSDDAGSQSVGQVVGMLGQLGQQAGQMGQQAGAPMQALGGQTGMFGSLMQSAMQTAQGAGGGGQASGGQGSGSPAAGAAPSAAGAVGQPQPSDEAPVVGETKDAVETKEDEARQPQEPRPEEPRHDERETPLRADDSRPTPGPVPVTPPEPPRQSVDDDLRRRL